MSRSSEIRTARYKANKQRQRMEDEDEGAAAATTATMLATTSMAAAGLPVQAGMDRPNAFPTQHNDQFNLNPVLESTIKQASYFRVCSRLTQFNALVDAVYNEVDHVEPFVEVHGVRTASTAFCLLYRLMEIKLTEKQMQSVLSHQDSPYIRALGALYVRIIGLPESLWDWLEPLFSDFEEFAPTHDKSKTCTVARWAEDLLDVRYYGTVLPRIPVPVERAIRAQLADQAKQQQAPAPPQTAGTGAGSRGVANSTALAPPNPPPQPLLGAQPPSRNPNGTHLEGYAPGTVCRAMYSEDGLWYDARIEEPGSSPDTFWVTFLPEDDYGNQEEVAIANIRLSPTSNPPAAATAPDSSKRARHDDFAAILE